METVTLEKLRFYVQDRINKTALNQTRIKIEDHPMFNELVFQLESFVWGMGKHTVTDKVVFPLTWWDHLKKDLGSRFKWFRKLKYKTDTRILEVTKFDAMCPHHHTAPSSDHISYIRFPDSREPYQVDLTRASQTQATFPRRTRTYER